MNKKVNVGTVTCLLDKKIPVQQAYSLLHQKGFGQLGFIFAEFKAGNGYLQWNLPGSDWLSFSQLTDAQKDTVTDLYRQIRASIAQKTAGTALEPVITTPSDEFLFFRNVETTPEIGLTAWGFRYPNKAESHELDTWQRKTALQPVRIAFLYDGAPKPNIPFQMAGVPNFTDITGWFEVDKPLPVGNKYPLTLGMGRLAFDLIVEAGKRDYEFDLTQWFEVKIEVSLDGHPFADCPVKITNAGNETALHTDYLGEAKYKFPLPIDSDGITIANGAAVKITVPEEVIASQAVITDETSKTAQNGQTVLFSYATLCVDPPEKPEEPEPEPDPEPDPEPEPEKNVSITILDYAGFPVVDMPVEIAFKSSGKQQFVTDSQGKIIIPESAFTPGEKFKVKFLATADYQSTHDLHAKKK